MTKPDYSSIIPYKVISIIELIINNKKLTFYDSIKYLYKSQMYNYLCNEETKLWHLSPLKLFDLLEQEKLTNIFQFPDFI